MAKNRLRFCLLGGCGSFLALVACNQVLGIDAAEVDPRLTGAASASSAHGAGTAQGGGDAKGGSSNVSGSAGLAVASGGSDQHATMGDSGAPASEGGEAAVGSAKGGTGGSSGGTTATGEHSKGGGGSTSDGGGAGETTSGPADPCDTYCDIMDTECQGDAAQYRDRDQCERICHLLPAGKDSDPDDDSIACRLKYAQKTHYANGTELTGYCHEAGPSGDGRCGTACDAFCALMPDVCTAESAGIYHFASDQDCLTTCNGLPPAGIAYSSNDPAVSDGNHALCRLFHVTSAAMADADEHCEHAMGVTLCQAPGQ